MLRRSLLKAVTAGLLYATFHPKGWGQDSGTPFIATPSGMSEILEQRGGTSKTFAKGQQRRLVAKPHMVHVPSSVPSWERAGRFDWTNPDTNVTLSRGNIVVENAWYELQADTQGPDYTVRTKREAGGYHQSILTAIPGHTLQGVTPTLRGNRIEYVDVVPGVDIVIVCKPMRVQVFKRIKTAAAPREMEWTVEETTDKLVRGQIIGVDNAGKTSVGERGNTQQRIVEMDQEIIQLTPPPTGGRRTRITETWTGRTIVRDKQTRTNDLRPLSEAVYPISIDPDITEEIGSNAEDGNQTGNTWDDLYNNFWGLNFWPGTGYWAGWRYTTIALDQGVTIDLANLIIEVSKINNGATATGSSCYGDDADDAAAWENSTRPTTRTKTSASTSVSDVTDSTGTYTIDVTSIVQGIVDRGGWSSNNAMAFFFAGGSSNGDIYIDDYGASSHNDAGTLEIDFTAAAGGDRRVVFIARLPGRFRRFFG